MIKCLPRFHRWTSSVWSKCWVILRRRKWGWTILSIIRSVFYLVRVTLYRFRVAQRINRSSNSDQCRQHTTGSVNTSRGLRHRNNHCNVEWKWFLPCSNWWIVARTHSISLWQTSIRSISRMLLKSNRFSDSKWVCWLKDWTIRDYSWVPRATRVLWRTASRLTCFRCLLDTIRFWSSSKQWIMRCWMCFPLYRWRS